MDEQLHFLVDRAEKRRESHHVAEQSLQHLCWCHGRRRKCAIALEAFIIITLYARGREPRLLEVTSPPYLLPKALRRIISMSPIHFINIFCSPFAIRLFIKSFGNSVFVTATDPVSPWRDNIGNIDLTAVSFQVSLNLSKDDQVWTFNSFATS